MQNYWIASFTDVTWRESRLAGHAWTGHNRPTVKKAKQGDVFVCLAKGANVSLGEGRFRFVGALRAAGDYELYDGSQPKVWKNGDYFHRLPTVPLVALDFEMGIWLENVRQQFVSYRGEEALHTRVYAMNSTRLPAADAQAMINMMAPKGYVCV